MQGNPPRLEDVPLPPGVDLLPEGKGDAPDARVLRRHLMPSGIRIVPDFAPRRFASGLANLNYLLLGEEGWLVLRRPPAGPLPPGAHDMAREHRILSRLWQELPLAPRSLALCSDPTVIGVPFQILEFRSGLSLRGTSVSPLPATPETGQSLSTLLVGTLARIHAVDPQAVGLGDLGRPDGFFARTLSGWMQRARLAGGEDSPAAIEVADWLSSHHPAPAKAPALLHSDFKLDNLLVDPASVTVGTVLDWDMGTRGPALFDLATMLSYWTEKDDPDCMHDLAQMPTANPGFLTREAAATAYARLTGTAIDDLPPHRVLALFKLATVFLQFHRRYQAGEARDARYATFGDLGARLFDLARDVTRGRCF